MGFVAGGATDAPVRVVVAFAVEDPVGLEPHIFNSPDAHHLNLNPGAVTGSAELSHAFGIEAPRIEDGFGGRRSLILCQPHQGDVLFTRAVTSLTGNAGSQSVGIQPAFDDCPGRMATEAVVDFGRFESAADGRFQGSRNRARSSEGQVESANPAEITDPALDVLPLASDHVGLPHFAVTECKQYRKFDALPAVGYGIDETRIALADSMEIRPLPEIEHGIAPEDIALERRNERSAHRSPGLIGDLVMTLRAGLRADIFLAGRSTRGAPFRGRIECLLNRILSLPARLDRYEDQDDRGQDRDLSVRFVSPQTVHKLYDRMYQRAAHGRN